MSCTPTSGQEAVTPTASECKTARDELGWSPERLAEEAGLTEKTVRDFEAGLRTPHPRTLIAIRRAFREAGPASTAVIAEHAR